MPVFSPHAVAKIMAAILVNEPDQDVTVYDPSAGSGTLLMNIAHAIGEDKCTIYSQDISQKSSSFTTEPDFEQSGTFHSKHHSG